VRDDNSRETFAPCRRSFDRCRRPSPRPFSATPGGRLADRTAVEPHSKLIFAFLQPVGVLAAEGPTASHQMKSLSIQCSIRRVEVRSLINSIFPCRIAFERL
jgi:hypothetical protein